MAEGYEDHGSKVLAERYGRTERKALLELRLAESEASRRRLARACQKKIRAMATEIRCLNASIIGDLNDRRDLFGKMIAAERRAEDSGKRAMKYRHALKEVEWERDQLRAELLRGRSPVSIQRDINMATTRVVVDLPDQERARPRDLGQLAHRALSYVEQKALTLLAWHLVDNQRKG